MKGVAFARGFSVAAVEAAIKKPGRNDLVILRSDRPADAAGVFTTNLFAAAPVNYCKEIIALRKPVRAVVVNAGNANAGTGEKGYEDVLETARCAASKLGCSADEILVASTGVIGRPMPMDRMRSGIAAAAEKLTHSSDGLEAAKAIMTTDTVEKLAEREICGVRIGGMAKGAGMIHPNMATMLGFLTTDAVIPGDLLRPMLLRAAETSFNCISVDNDMSTNDSLFLLANGASGIPAPAEFETAVTGLCVELAKKIVADGEGATKLVTIAVRGAADDREAYLAADAVATSMLVKTALFGNDPNWGRILAAVGRSGARVDTQKVTIALCGVAIFEKGAPLDADLGEVSAKMKNREISIEIDLDLASGSKTVYTSDLTRDYVSINADYTT